ANLEAFTEANVEAKLRELGWGYTSDLRWGGRIWLPPGRHNFPQQGRPMDDPNAPPPALKIIPDREVQAFVQVFEQRLQAFEQRIIDSIKTALKTGEQK